MTHVGRGGLVVACMHDIAYPDTMIRVRPAPDRLIPAYLQLIWRSRPIREQIEGVARTTAGIWKVSQTDLERIRVPTPTVDQQEAIVRRVRPLLDLADRLERRAVAAIHLVDRTEPALLAKAFRGELVPQDPNDEPADALLARIKAQRATPAPATKRRTARSPA